MESEREVEVDTGVTIVPSIVTETPEVIEQTRNVTNERQPVVKEPAKETEQRVLKQKVAPHVVRKDNEQLERDRLEQQSLELAKKLTERERLEKLKKDELEQQSLTLAMQLAEEERIILEHTSPSKKEERLAKLEEEARRKAELEKVQQQETPSEESSSWFGKVKKWFSSSPTTNSEVEMTTFVNSDVPKSGFCFDEEQISDMQLAGHGHHDITVQ